MTPEQKARVSIDALLVAAGWHVCNVLDANIHAGDGAAKGVAIREFPLNTGFGFADYLLYVNGKACGVIEAKKQGATLTGVELQSGRYAQGLPTTLPAWSRPAGGAVADLFGGSYSGRFPIFWLKDDSLADSDNLPAPGVIALEIVEDLQAALEQFKLIAADMTEDAIE